MYSDAFAGAYNTLGWNYYPEEVAEELFAMMRARDLHFARALDLGCGTGILCGKLAEAGMETEGADLSPAMIAVARENCPGVKFAVADMRVFVPETTPDLVTCTCDALNHLPTIEDIAQTFRTVKSYLAPGGLFLFDVLSGTQIGTGEPIDIDFSETLRAVVTVVSEGNKLTLTTEAFDKINGSFTEVVEEYYYPIDEIFRLLEEAGFTDIEIRRSLTDSEEHTGSATYFLAR